MTFSQEIISELRNSGYRITMQRELIINAIAEGNRHMPVEDILAKLQETTSAINLATIYRTLDILWKEGFVYRNDLHEGKMAYSLVAHGPHIHLVCRHCKEVIEISVDELQPLRDTLLHEHGFDADLKHLSLFGVCARCEQKADSQK
jgi:Fur family ferric uptake transcriptional regulator